MRFDNAIILGAAQDCRNTLINY